MVGATDSAANRLRAARVRRGWTEDDVAVRLHQLAGELGEPSPGADANQISKWERGARGVGRYYQPRLCLVFETRPEELGWAATPRLVHDIEELRQRRPAPVAATGAAPAGVLEPSRAGLADPDTPSSLEADIAASAAESAWFVRRSGMRVEAEMLDQIGAEIALVARQYLGQPPHALFPPIAQLRRDVFALLDTHQPARHTMRLYFLAGQLCSLLAHLTTDLARHEAAETHARTAWLCAELCDHHGLRSYIRWVQAQIAYWNGRYRTAAEIARSARPFATDRASMLRITSQEARAWAAAGEAGEAERSLDARKTAGELSESRDLVGVFRFPPAKAAYYASEVLLALGGERNARRAMSAAEESLSLLANGADEDSCPEFIAAAHLDLALAHLALSSLDGAVEQLRPVLEMSIDHRTVQVIGRVSKVRSVLARYVSEQTAAEMRERLGQFVAYPAARQLAATTEA